MGGRRVYPLQIVVQGELGEGFPGRREGVHLDGIETERRFVAHRTGRDQRNALHRSETQFASVLLRKIQAERAREFSFSAIKKKKENKQTNKTRSGRERENPFGSSTGNLRLSGAKLLIDVEGWRNK